MKDPTNSQSRFHDLANYGTPHQTPSFSNLVLSLHGFDEPPSRFLLRRSVYSLTARLHRLGGLRHGPSWNPWVRSCQGAKL